MYIEAHTVLVLHSCIINVLSKTYAQPKLKRSVGF